MLLATTCSYSDGADPCLALSSLQDLLMYLLQLVQALKYESFNDIQGGLEPGSKRDSQGLSDDSTLDRSEQHQQSRPLAAYHMQAAATGMS